MKTLQKKQFYKREVPMKTNVILTLMLALILLGCDNEEVLKEQTAIQATEQIEAQNRNTIEWSTRLASDLEKRRGFIDAVEGEFEGDVDLDPSISNGVTYRIRLILTPTIPGYEVDRTKTLAELEYELQNLNLNVQVTQWNPELDLSAVGCIIENVKPDLVRGVINLVSENCNNSYQIFLSEGRGDASGFMAMGTYVASLVEEGGIDYIQSFNGKLRSSNNARMLTFNLDRI